MGALDQLPGLEEARALGGTLRRVDPSLLKPTPYRRRWYRGTEPYLEVTVDEDEAGVLALEVYLRGRFVRLTRAARVVTGTTDELALNEAAPSSRREAQDGKAAHAVVDAARAVLEGHDELRALAGLLDRPAQARTARGPLVTAASACESAPSPACGRQRCPGGPSSR